MREFTIQFHSFQDVQEFVALATEYPFPITVGYDGYQVNDTSFMGMFTLDYSRPLTAAVNCSETEFGELVGKLGRFLVR